MKTSLLSKSAAVVVAIVALLAVGSAVAIEERPEPEPQGCTLTPGYWKTHSEHGPAPYDEVWGELASGADTEFFETGRSYYDVLWTPPKRGNAYYILAHAYIAVELNMLSGASVPEDAAAAWDEASDLFATYLPEDIADLKGEERRLWIVLAEVLDQYNNGLIGPGHCDDVDMPDWDDGIIIPQLEPPLPPTPEPSTGELGCTLTHGYWKNHSEFGPAPYDDTWAELPDGAGTDFFLSGQNYHDVLRTPPKGGNGYYILARQYIAAELNMLSGASIPEATADDWDDATGLFNTYSPEEIAGLKGEERGLWVMLAEVLDQYNNGLIGPGHCDDVDGPDWDDDIIIPEFEPPLPPTPAPSTDELGCTLTRGYWKTHSEFGPAPYDDTWAGLPDGASTDFFLSGQNYHDVMWTPPKGGNAYYILAYPYIAAELNVLNGASLTEDAADAWDEATALFGGYLPEEVAALKGEERAPWIALSTAIGHYNEGLTGPGHCMDANGDGGVDALDVQTTINNVLEGSGKTSDAADIQQVINTALGVY